MKKYIINLRTGQSLVEWALILPVFLLVIMAIIDFGRVTYTFSALFNAVREGARYGSIHPTDVTGIKNTVQHMAVGLNVNPSQVIINKSGRNLQVSVINYQFNIITPFFNIFVGSNPFILPSIRATMRTEQ
jgi:hypothetical protein